MINRPQFAKLLNNMDQICSENVAQFDTSFLNGEDRNFLVLVRGKEEIDYMMSKIDPDRINLITYS